MQADGGIQGMINEIKEKILDEIRCGELNNDNGLLPTWLNKPEILHYAEYMRCFQDGVTCKQYTDAVIVKKLFKEFEKVDVPGTNVGEWIPCSERLPEDDKPVLIQYHDEEDEAIMFVGCYEYGYFNVWDERIFPDYEEVAWMPLPEAYKISD